jgi:predicted ATPase
MHTKGFAAQETKTAVERARLLVEQAEALGEPPEDPLLLFSVLHALWAANQVAFNGGALRELSAQFLALAEKRSVTALLMIGHRVTGATMTCIGDFVDGRAHCDRAIALYNPAEHRPLAMRFGQDNRVTALLYRSACLWALGYPEAALSDTDLAIKEARDVGQATTLMYTLTFASFALLSCGSYASFSARLDELLTLADEKSSSYWKAHGLLWQGCFRALTGYGSEAIPVMTSTLSAFRSTGSTILIPAYLSFLARAYAYTGRLDEAWPCISEAIELVEKTNERWWEAEAHRVAGEIALLSTETETTKAQAYLERALTVARAQQAKSWELRAAMSLARLWRSQGKVQQARELLAPVYGWFTEGFDTRDLKEAKALLDELHA